MRIHISWKALLAIMLFLMALGLLLRSASRLWTSEAHMVVTATPTAPQNIAQTRVAETALTVTIPATATRSPSPGAAAAATPTLSGALAATRTIIGTSVPSPQPTLPTPSPTPVQPPTREPTPAPNPLTVVSQGFGQRAGTASYAFVVSNPNPNLLAQNVRYQVAAFNADGVVLLADTDSIAQIGPGQRMGVAKQVNLPANLTVSRIEVLIRPGQFVQAPPLQELPVSNVAFIQGDPPSITGILSNPLNRDLANIRVVGIAYDDVGIIGGGAIEVPFAPARGQAPISIPVSTSQTATRVEFFAQVSAAP
ncbi:MAG: hypothetical protein RMK84_06750 [Oscillochloridaceae bacterium]|nr:hypothetical protein [Chloroflexaceae bacterium]MDW8389807.1 hypothetical protein [Oscillochloridaceae bacterium]